MKHTWHALLSAAALLLAASAGWAQTPAEQLKLAQRAGQATAKVIYRGLTLVDGVDSKQPARANMAIVVAGERIAAILPAAQLDAATLQGAEVVDARGLYAIPGLIDAHVHYATNPARAWAEAELKRDIYGGITGVRDMAGDARALADLSRAALINEIKSPDIFYAALVAGPSFFKDPRTVSSSQGLQPGTVPWLYAVDDKTDLALAIAQARGTGATGLKIYANLPGPLVQGLIAAAKQQGFPVWTHLQVFPATPYDSLGATAVSHVCMIGRYVRAPDKASYPSAKAPVSYAGLKSNDPEIANYIAAMAKSGTAMDATLSVYLPVPNADGSLPPQRGCPVELAGAIAHDMQAAGIPLVAGTDTGAGPDNPYPALFTELELLVRHAGLTPYEALVAASRNTAAVLHRSRDFGTLEVGKFANLVLLRADPLKDIANLRSLQLTVKRGQRFPRGDYHHLPIIEQDDY